MFICKFEMSCWQIYLSDRCIFPLFSVFALSYGHWECFMINLTLLNIVRSSEKQ